MSRILVIGKSGQLASALGRLTAVASWAFIDRKAMDLSQIDAIEAVLSAHPFDILINTAAYTAVDDAEDDPETAEKVNAAAPGIMARHCQRKGAVFIHISTDYVFGGSRARPFREGDDTQPLGVYGHTKLAGEEAVRVHCPRHIIIRTSWLYGPIGHNFLLTMLKLADTRKELQVVFDQVGAPTLADDLALAILRVVEVVEHGDNHFGTFHYANEGVASWFDFAHAIFALSGKKMIITPVTSDAFPTKASRPAYSVLHKQKIKDTFDIQIRHWRDALAACLDEMNRP